MAVPYPNTTYMTPSTAPPGGSSQIKPTLLAFHGSGSNSTIHMVQLARLTRYLKPHFNIESMEAPFPSAAGPGILPFFEGCGPFKRWLPPSEKLSIDAMKRGEASSTMPAEVESLVRGTVSRIRASGGSVVGLIGFSQGTRVVAGLLKGAEIRTALNGPAEVNEELDWLDFSFALSVCASYPPPLVPACASEALAKSALGLEEQTAVREGKIGIPTLHVQGAQDEWVGMGKLLIEGSYDVGDESKSRVLELDMGHHYPVQPEDTEKIKDWVFGVYHGVGVDERR